MPSQNVINCAGDSLAALSWQVQDSMGRSML